MTWREVARGQSGVVSRAQLFGCGLTRHRVDGMLRRSELVRMSGSVYLVGGAPVSFQARLWGAVLATDGVLAYWTAGRLWGVCDIDDGSIHVTIPHARRLVAPAGVALHRVTLPAGTVRERSHLPVTSRPWTVLDLLGVLEPAEAGRLADRAMQRGWIRADDLDRRLRDGPRRPGNTALARIGATLGDGAAAESERRAHRLLRRAGITGWLPNYEIWSGGELIAVADIAVPARRLAVEIDGMAYHTDVDRFRRDRSRQNALVALGWTVLRFTWSDLTERPGYVVATIRRLAA